MPPETGTATADAAAQANVDAQGGGGYTGPRAIPTQQPDLSTLTARGQGVVKHDENMRALIDGKYKDVDGSMDRLRNLSPEQQEQLLTDPSVLGELRHGVDPSSVRTESLYAGSRAYDLEKPEDRREANSYTNDAQAWQERQAKEEIARGENEQNNSLEGKTNASLQNAPSMTHHLSI